MRDTSHGNRSRDEGYETVHMFRSGAVAIEPFRDCGWHRERYASHTILGNGVLILMIWSRDDSLVFFGGSTRASVLQTQALEESRDEKACLGWPLFSTRVQCEKERLLQKANAESVLNGITYDVKRNRLSVTGKLWPFIV